MRQGFIALVILANLFHAAAARADEAPNCFIKITGKQEKIRFGTRLRSKAECQALARIHQRNADLDANARKKVDYRWKARRLNG